MTMVRVNGLVFPQPNIWINTGASGNGISQIIDATGEKMAFCGQVRWFDGSATKAIRKFHFQPGTVVSAGGSGLTFSLQDLDPTTGGPPRPDGVQDQTASALLSTISTNSWYTTPALNADRTVSPGDFLAAVVEFDGGGRLGSDSLQFTHNAIANSAMVPGVGGMALFHDFFWDQNFSGGAHGNAQFALEFSDGTYGQLGNSMPSNFYSGQTFNTGSTFDEWALRFKIPFDCTVEGCWGQFSVTGPGNNRGATVNLYDGLTNLLASVNVDSETTVNSSLAERFDITFPSEIALSKNSVYYLSLKATTAGNISNSRFTIPLAGLTAGMDGGIELYTSSRKGGAWTDETNTRPNFGLRISKIDDGAGA